MFKGVKIACEADQIIRRAPQIWAVRQSIGADGL
jgi:hypothetical protein